MGPHHMPKTHGLTCRTYQHLHLRPWICFKLPLCRITKPPRSWGLGARGPHRRVCKCQVGQTVPLVRSGSIDRNYVLHVFLVWHMECSDEYYMIFLLVYMHMVLLSQVVFFLVSSRGNKNVGRWTGCLVVVLACEPYWYISREPIPKQPNLLNESNQPTKLNE